MVVHDSVIILFHLHGTNIVLRIIIGGMYSKIKE